MHLKKKKEKHETVWPADEGKMIACRINYSKQFLKTIIHNHKHHIIHKLNKLKIFKYPQIKKYFMHP